MENKKKSLLIAVIMSVIVLAISFAVTEVGGILGGWLIVKLVKNASPEIKFALMYASFFGVWIVLFIVALIGKRSRKTFYRFKIEKKRIKPALIVGLSCGIGINLLVAIMAMIHGDIKLHFNEFNIGMILLFLVCVAIQCGAEEIVDRWYVYEALRYYFPDIPFIAIVANAAIFAGMHMGNPGVTPLATINILVVGILYALMVYYFDSLWAPIIAHTGWNFCQSIILGLPNSGEVSKYSIFKLDAASATNSLVYNTGFGIEGTVATDVLFVIAIVLVVYFGRKYKAAQAQ